MLHYCLLNRLPVEIFYILFDYFVAHELFLIFSNISDYIDSIIHSYPNHRLHLKLIMHSEKLQNRSNGYRFFAWYIIVLAGTTVATIPISALTTAFQFTIKFIGIIILKRCYNPERVTSKQCWRTKSFICLTLTCLILFLHILAIIATGSISRIVSDIINFFSVMKLHSKREHASMSSILESMVYLSIY